MNQEVIREVIIITYKNGVRHVLEKTQATYDLIVFEFENIEEVEYADYIETGAAQ
ncbi:MAG: hypothetical protein Unbinned627contig1001_32 [Prokaryotic dsDNA virus sp.]|jgi:hypothetical protein|nr:MAG: hypothetical protein Unbinned627contig1001_32 [Prokaryotic dsDNA virus sp.]|tara:strand:+ start:3447 stop:3611 length:165 start_codon:yes stop_codon:yes gene_type:complete